VAANYYDDFALIFRPKERRGRLRREKGKGEGEKGPRAIILRPAWKLTYKKEGGYKEGREKKKGIRHFANPPGD